MKNWLEIAVGIYLLGMVLYGHYRGLIRLAVSMAALAITLVTVHFAMPYVGTFVKDKTPIYAWITDSVSDAFGVSKAEELPDAQMPAAQRQFIEEMHLPEDLKNVLIENNNREVYAALGVDAFAEYIGNYLANVVIQFVGFVVLFLVVYISLKLLAGALDLVAKLPILSGMNQLAGALLGGFEGLFFLWLAALLITVFSAFSWASALLEQIAASPWLLFLYRYNLISRLLLGVVRGIIA